MKLISRRKPMGAVSVFTARELSKPTSCLQQIPKYKYLCTHIYTHNILHKQSSFILNSLIWRKSSLANVGHESLHHITKRSSIISNACLAKPIKFSQKPHHPEDKNVTLHSYRWERSTKKNVVYSNHKMWQPLTIWSKPRQHSQKAAKTDI